MELAFAVVGAHAEAYAAEPTLVLRLKITETTGTPVHAVALKCQIRIEPQRRKYQPAEEARLIEVFGETPQWGDSLRPFLWTHVATTVTSFTGETVIDLPITCTYDFEIAASKYLHSLDDDDIPLVLLFSGTIFGKGDVGFTVAPVAWHADTTFRLPVQVWRDTMNLYFPNSGWMRLSRDTLDALTRFKAKHALTTWDHTMERLLKEAGEDQ